MRSTSTQAGTGLKTYYNSWRRYLSEYNSDLERALKPAGYQLPSPWSTCGPIVFNHAYHSWLAGLAFVALTGCGGVSLSFAYFDDISEESVQEISFQDITPVIPSAIRDHRLVVIRDLSNWDALWREHTAGVSSTPALPPINFTRDMVIGIFLGTPTGLCRDVQILAVSRYFNPDHIDVTFREVTILSGINCATPNNNPFRLIALPYSSLPVNFIQVE